MKTVLIRDLEIGSGVPGIIVPIVARTSQDIIDQGAALVCERVDIVEWRVDFYEDVDHVPSVLDTLKALRQTVGAMPILFTFRTKREGGQREITPSAYIELNTAVAQSGYADMIDVEIFFGDDFVRTCIHAIKDAGKIVIASNHDFFTTPSKSDMISRLKKMQAMDADILKIAVMPTCQKDVLVLMEATAEMYAQSDRPLVTMSMGAQGLITRLAGEQFGSSMTFGCVGKGSAPGQISSKKLSDILEIIHESTLPSA